MVTHPQGSSLGESPHKGGHPPKNSGLYGVLQPRDPPQWLGFRVRALGDECIRREVILRSMRTPRGVITPGGGP